eukprot:s986_g10.t1
MTRSRLGLCISIGEMVPSDVIWADTVKEAEHLLQSLLQGLCEVAGCTVNIYGLMGIYGRSTRDRRRSCLQMNWRRCSRPSRDSTRGMKTAASSLVSPSAHFWPSPWRPEQTSGNIFAGTTSCSAAEVMLPIPMRILQALKNSPVTQQPFVHRGPKRAAYGQLNLAAKNSKPL